MNDMDVLRLNKIFDNENEQIFLETQLNIDIDRYNNLKKEMSNIKNKIDRKTSNTNYYFDSELGLLKQKEEMAIYLNTFFMFNDINNNKFDILNEKIIIDKSIFDAIAQKIKDKSNENIAKFINDSYKNFDCLKKIENYIKHFFCGICSENNIIKVETNFIDNNKSYYIYKITIAQNENGIQNLYGEIAFTLENINKKNTEFKNIQIKGSDKDETNSYN